MKRLSAGSNGPCIPTTTSHQAPFFPLPAQLSERNEMIRTVRKARNNGDPVAWAMILVLVVLGVTMWM